MGRGEGRPPPAHRVSGFPYPICGEVVDMTWGGVAAGGWSTARAHQGHFKTIASPTDPARPPLRRLWMGAAGCASDELLEESPPGLGGKAECGGGDPGRAPRC